MKKFYSSLILLTLISLSFIGCKSTVDNSFTFNNSSGTDLIVNFRAKDIKIKVGQKVAINEIPKGTYTYATSFSNPVGATSISSLGDVTGTVVLKAGTKILVIYTSTFINGVFTLSATLSSSDDQSTPTSP